MSHFGDLIGAKKAPVSKPVPTPVVQEPPSRESFKVEEKDKNNFSEMSKKQLEVYGRTVGIELDRRHSKSKLLKELQEHIDNS
jgi:hypothetical protein